MTNQLDESSQNQIIFIENVEQFDKLKKNQKFKFICKNCGKEATSSKSGSIVKREKQERLFCRECSIIDSKIKKYGSLCIPHDSNINYVMINNTDEFDNLKPLTPIKFVCKDCNKITTLKIAADRKNRERQKRLLCKSCGTKRTVIDKYGVEYLLQSQKIKDKIVETNIEKFGCSNPNGNKEVREKIKKTCLERYGTDNAAKNKDVIEKTKQTNLNKYGTTCTLHADGIKDKVTETWIHKYGVDHPLKNPEILNKGINTKLKKYGSLRFKQPMYKYNEIIFDSSWELIFYIYHVDSGSIVEREPNPITYMYKGENHLYYPDFLINGKLYEIKGNYFFENGKMINPFNRNEDDLFEAKYQCALQNNVIFIKDDDIIFYKDYVDNKYGKDYIKKFLV